MYIALSKRVKTLTSTNALCIDCQKPLTAMSARNSGQGCNIGSFSTSLHTVVRRSAVMFRMSLCRMCINSPTKNVTFLLQLYRTEYDWNYNFWSRHILPEDDLETTHTLNKQHQRTRALRDESSLILMARNSTILKHHRTLQLWSLFIYYTLFFLRKLVMLLVLEFLKNFSKF